MEEERLFIREDNRDVTGEQPTTEITVDLSIADPDIDVLRVKLRNDWVIFIKELFTGNGLIYELSLQTHKGTKPFATFRTFLEGTDAVRVQKPDVL